jgi:hypothetical protein
LPVNVYWYFVKDNKCKKKTEQKWNSLLAQDLLFNWQWRVKVHVHEAICLSGSVPSGHVNFTTHTSTVCIQYQDFWPHTAKPQTRTHLFIASDFLPLFYMCIIFCFMIFLFYSFFFAAPSSATLGDCIVCLVVELAVPVCINDTWPSCKMSFLGWYWWKHAPPIFARIMKVWILPVIVLLPYS